MNLYPFFKRAADLIFSALLLILLCPLLLLIALALLLCDGRPVLFSQQRAGRGGKPFTLIKFRTMAPAQGLGEHSTARVTRLGGLLRRFALDELPQLFNILKGEMSFIGPRPLLCEYLSRYTPEQARRHLLRPGLSGLAQVSGRNNTSWEERLKLDCRYVDEVGPLLDLKILLLTFKCLLDTKSVNHSEQDTMPALTGSRETALLILGAGGQGRVVADAARESGLYKRIAFLDDGKANGSAAGCEVLGGFSRCMSLKESFANAVVAIGDNRLRLRLLRRLKRAGYVLPVILHPRATVSAGAEIGEGSVILAGAVVVTGARIGRGCIVNTLAGVDHDCRLGDGVHICPGAHLAGSVSVGECTTVCTSAGVANNLEIGRDCLIAACAAVTHDLPDGVMAAGVPAVIKKANGGKR